MADGGSAGAAGAAGAGSDGTSGVRRVGGRRGRPPLPDAERRSYRVHIPLSDAAYARLAARAERAGERPSTTLGRVVVERLRAFLPDPAPSAGELERVRAAAARLNAELRMLNAEAARGALVDVGGSEAERLRSALTALREALRGSLHGRPR